MSKKSVALSPSWKKLNSDSLHLIPEHSPVILWDNSFDYPVVASWNQRMGVPIWYHSSYDEGEETPIGSHVALLQSDASFYWMPLMEAPPQN